MPCDIVKTPTKRPTIAIVCHRGRRRSVPACACGRVTTRLCDGRGPTPGSTCDAKLCSRCTTRVGSLDYCPACTRHQALPL